MIGFRPLCPSPSPAASPLPRSETNGNRAPLVLAMVRLSSIRSVQHIAGYAMFGYCSERKIATRFSAVKGGAACARDHLSVNHVASLAAQLPLLRAGSSMRVGSRAANRTNSGIARTSSSR